MNRKTGRMFFTGKRKCFTGAPHDDETAAAFPAVRLQKAGQRLAQGRIVLCGEYSSTLRQVLECSPQSMLAHAAGPRDANRGRATRHPLFAPHATVARRRATCNKTDNQARAPTPGTPKHLFLPTLPPRILKDMTQTFAARRAKPFHFFCVSLLREVTKRVYFIGNERMLIAHDSNRLRFS